jgi:hypothetical protein
MVYGPWSIKSGQVLTSVSVLRAEQFGLESLDPELTTEDLTAERFKVDSSKSKKLFRLKLQYSTIP